MTGHHRWTRREREWRPIFEHGRRLLRERQDREAWLDEVRRRLGLVTIEHGMPYAACVEVGWPALPPGTTAEIVSTVTETSARPRLRRPDPADRLMLGIRRRRRRAVFVEGVAYGVLWTRARSGGSMSMAVPATVATSAERIARSKGRGFRVDPHACPGPAVCACVHLPRATWVDVTLDAAP